MPTLAFDTDEIVSAVVSSHARLHFDGNRYSVPADLARKTVMLRAQATQLRVLFQGVEVARPTRCYDRGQVICLSDHQLQALQKLFDCEFVEQRHCAILIGRTGIGKTHLLTALAYTACEKGLSVRFTRVIDMINTLTTAQMNGTLERALKYYVNPSLLLLDELGYLPIDQRGADLMFQVVAARYESGSIVITTNRPFRDWGKIFDADNTLATAMIDRLMHHGEAILMEGDRSFRDPENNPE